MHYVRSSEFTPLTDIQPSKIDAIGNYTNGLGTAFRLGRTIISGSELVIIEKYDQTATNSTTPEYGSVEQLHNNLYALATSTEHAHAHWVGFRAIEGDEGERLDDMVTYPSTSYLNTTMAEIHSWRQMSPPAVFVPITAQDLIRDDKTDSSVVASYLKDRQIPYAVPEVRKFIGEMLIGTTRMNHEVIDAYANTVAAIYSSQSSFEDIDNSEIEQVVASFFSLAKMLSQFGMKSANETIPVNVSSIRQSSTAILDGLRLSPSFRVGSSRNQKKRLLSSLADHQTWLHDIQSVKQSF